MLRSIVVRAVWDDEAQTWVATGEDVPGIVTGAHTIEELHADTLPRIEELIELNSVELEGSAVPMHIFAEIATRVANPRAVA